MGVMANFRQIFFYDRAGKVLEALNRLNTPVEEVPYDSYPVLKDAVDTFKIDSIVSPGNSYGHLDGGFDLAISNYYREAKGLTSTHVATKELKQELLSRNGKAYTPVGHACLVDGGIFTPVKLIHVPTMEQPSIIPPDEASTLIFKCMWNLLKEIDRYNGTMPSNPAHRILLTGLGTGTGGVSPESCAVQMNEAISLYDQDPNPDSKTWDSILDKLKSH